MTLARIGRLLAVTILGSVFLSTSASALFSPRIEDFEETVVEELAAIGISDTEIVDLRVYPHYDRRNLVDRATGWVRIDDCPEGWIVVNMSAFATVTYTYTHGNCQVPGLD